MKILHLIHEKTTSNSLFGEIPGVVKHPYRNCIVYWLYMKTKQYCNTYIEHNARTVLLFLLWFRGYCWYHINWVNITSCNGLLPGGTKPLPRPMLIYNQQWLLGIHPRALSPEDLKIRKTTLKPHVKNVSRSNRDQWVYYLAISEGILKV